MIIKSTLILDSEYFNYINNLIDIKYSYILNLNIYSELLIDNIDICFYYLVFNDLNILLDNNNKIIKKIY